MGERVTCIRSKYSTESGQCGCAVHGVDWSLGGTQLRGWKSRYLGGQSSLDASGKGELGSGDSAKSSDLAAPGVCC